MNPTLQNIILRGRNGKNLFNKNSLIRGFFLIATGVPSANAIYGYTYVKIKPNTKYFMNYKVVNNTFWTVNKGGPSIFTFGTTSGFSPATAEWLSISIMLSEADLSQLELGPIGTDYQQYGGY